MQQRLAQDGQRLITRAVRRKFRVRADNVDAVSSLLQHPDLRLVAHSDEVVIVAVEGRAAGIAEPSRN